MGPTRIQTQDLTDSYAESSRKYKKKKIEEKSSGDYDDV